MSNLNKNIQNYLLMNGYFLLTFKKFVYNSHLLFYLNKFLEFGIN